MNSQALVDLCRIRRKGHMQFDDTLCVQNVNP